MDFPSKDDGLDPERIVETRWLAYRWGFESPRHLETTLKKLGVKPLPIGKGISLVRIRDIWDAFDNGKNNA